MIHENWIPIEQFDKEAELDKGHLFLSYYVCPEYGNEFFDYDSGCWDGICFYNGDVSFEPTHYLNPAVYRKDSQ